jgi:hypothetical protein
MNRRAVAFLILTLCVARSSRASSQSFTDSARVGDRIRVHRFDARHARTGTLIARSDDSLTVEWSSGTRESMPAYAVQQIDVSQGHSHYVRRGMLYGLVMGACVGVITRKIAASDSSEWGSRDLRPNGGLIGIAALGGVAFGALAGAMGTENWRPIPIRQAGPRSGVGPVPPAQLSIALNARF